MLILFVNLPVYAQVIPDYYEPSAPIFTDKPSYSWTEKVYITIIAPSWNANTNGIDSIGSDESHPIKTSTGKFALSPYKLVETTPSSGVFVGEITLTGFSHDVDGDNKSDTNPRTIGNGPTNGYLETPRDGGITISFEFAEGVVLIDSSEISWNIGNISFLEQTFDLDGNVNLQVEDPDMNLNPEGIDTIAVEIFSDSDIAGIKIDTIETSENSGIFEGVISFSKNDVSSGNRLLATQDDSIYAIYRDRTLPAPYSISDDLEIKTVVKIKSIIPTLERISQKEILFADSSGKPLNNPSVNNQFQIENNIQNNQDFDQNFIHIIQILDIEGTIVSLSWIKGEIQSNQILELSQSWNPSTTGEFFIETYIWKSIADPTPLSPFLSKSILIQ